MEWKIKTKSDSPAKVKAIGGKERFKALYICYMHSRHCYKALNDAFGLAWSERTIDSSLDHELEYGSNWKSGKQGQKFVTVAYSECRVSVMLNGVEITGRNGRASSADIEPAKSAESNAFKRAVAKFGYGNELYSYPKVYIETRGSDKKFSYPPDQKVIQPALDYIYDLVNSGIPYNSAYFIDYDGKLSSFAYGWADKPIRMGSTPSSKPPIPKKVVKKTTPKKEKKVAVSTTLMGEPVPADIMAWPPIEQKNSANWAKFIKAWDGNIQVTTTQGYIIVIIGTNDRILYYRISDEVMEYLTSLNKHKSWKGKMIVASKKK